MLLLSFSLLCFMQEKCDSTSRKGEVGEGETAENY
jgi:hypothetical protein